MVLIALFATALFCMVESDHTHQAKIANYVCMYVCMYVDR